jgi:Flp pilus assembly protein TadG
MIFKNLHRLAGRGVGLVHRFATDCAGAYVIIFALAAPGLIGFAGLASEGGLWLYQHQKLQGAADSAALSAATLHGADATATLDTQSKGVAATYGFDTGTAGTTVTVHTPPATGNYTANTKAVEVILTVSQPRLLSSLFTSTPFTIRARAVALASNAGNGCVLALDPTASGAVSSSGSSAITLTGCAVFDDSNNSSSALTNGGSATISAESVNVVGGISGGSGITTVNGNHTGILPVADPYANVVPPAFSGCASNGSPYHSTVTLNPGVYCNGFKLNAGANVTLNPGIYYFDRGSFDIAGSATLQGTGVTLVFTSSTGSNWATATINGGATVNLTAPTTGTMAGLVVYGDHNTPLGTAFKFNGGANQTITGAIDVSTGYLQYAGNTGAGSSGCLQVIGDTVTFTGNSNLAVNCTGVGTKPIGASSASLIE